MVSQATSGAQRATSRRAAARTFLSAALIGTLAALSACGGGGGGPAPAPTPVPTPPPPPPPSSGFGPAQTDPGNPSYGADLRAAFDAINATRTAAGLGVLVQSTNLDVASAGHSNFLAVNQDISGHDQVTGRPGFTGLDPTARSVVAGYSNQTLGYESISQQVQLVAATEGVNDLLTTPFHRIGLMDHRVREVGLGYVGSAGLSTSGVYVNDVASLVVSTGLRGAALGQGMTAAAGEISVFPVAGATEVQLIMGSESPNPVAAELGAWGPGRYPGYAVSVQIPGSKVLAVTSFTISLVSGGTTTPVAAKVIDRNDGTLLGPLGIRHWAFAVPLAPLATDSTYEASFSGSADGVPVTKTWRFTTRANAITAATPRRDSTGTRIFFGYRSASGFVATNSVAVRNCGSSYAVSVQGGLHETVVTETGARPLAGCMLDVTVSDLVTGNRHVQTFQAN